MADVTLTSAPSEVDKQKVKDAVQDTLEAAPLTRAELKQSMQEIADRITLGEFNHADAPRQSFAVNVTATVSQTPSLVVNFTWSF